MAQAPSLIGSILEREPGIQSSSSLPRSTGKNGFPAVQHRSKSAFSRGRDDLKKSNLSGRPQHVPKVISASIPPTDVAEQATPQAESNSSDDWRYQIEDENRRKVEDMTEEEREEDRREILERFGPGVGDTLRKAREAREAAQKGSVPSSERKVLRSAMASRPSSPTPLSTSSTRPPSRTDRHIRFADVTPMDVHVYESAPPSPRRKPLALMSPSADDGPTISLGEWKGRGKEILLGNTGEPPHPTEQTSLKQSPKEVAQPNDGLFAEEGTPEDIRRRFFPALPSDQPSLAWIQGPDSQSDNLATNPALRFDLSGTPIPAALISTLPTHLGLHHHADGTHAGYTLDDIFLLSRSTVPAQRASMLDILGKIARKLAQSANKTGSGIPELHGQEAELRKRILASGVELMAEKGSVGVRAVEAIWVCIVYWESNLLDVEGVELRSKSDDILASLPLDYILTQMTESFQTAVHPPESLQQLLAILQHLAQASNDVASTIVSTPKLVANLMSRFLLTPMPPSHETEYPDPLALRVLINLVSGSRINAKALVQPAETLLRFVVILPTSSPYPPSLATSLLTSTLRLYTALASYGLGAHLATTASEYLSKVGDYVLNAACESMPLVEAWLGLLEAWMVCAQDPHRTTPGHDILWSQIVGWGWGENILELRSRLSVDHLATWEALWRAESAWLEGSSVNGVRGGEAEKSSALSLLRDGFESGTERLVTTQVVGELGSSLDLFSPQSVSNIEDWRSLTKSVRVLAAAVRLWLSCLPTQPSGTLAAPPFALPFAQIFVVCGRLTTHPLWAAALSPDAPTYALAFLRPLSRLLSCYLDLSRVLPGISEDLWMAQSFAVLCRLLPGDEETAVGAIKSTTSLVNSQFMESRGWHVPPIIWEKKGMEIILPFLVYSLRHSEVQVSPLWITPLSISSATTQRLPADLSTSRTDGPLPLAKDWFLSPLDQLLRSGQSDVFKSLPSSWDASETELVRATLLLAKMHREVLCIHSLHAFALCREECVFNCMKVFMLEHGQQQVTSTEEVFRDSIVGQLMDDLLAPFTVAASASASSPLNKDTGLTLDVVAKRFLGPSTPFYQFYTDFVALYDSISFSHPLFARLLLSPVSMRYPPDYRKYLWADFSHVLRTIRTPMEAVVASDVKEFMWPVETNPEVIAAYLRSLVKAQVEGFLRFAAVHHIACNIWPDLQQQNEDGSIHGEKSIKLLQAVAGQCGFDVVKELVTYRQNRETTLLPPTCFEISEEVKTSRSEFVNRCGAAVKDKIEPLLQ